MSSTLWRAAELPIPNGSIAVDVAGSGRFAQHTVSISWKGLTRTIFSLQELKEVLEKSQSSAEQLAQDQPVQLAYLLCILSGRSRHVFPRDSMWPELETHFGLSRVASQPRVEQGAFIFVTYSQYLPVLTVSRITVNLSTLDLLEEEIIHSPWPPSARAASPSGHPQ